MPDLPDVVAPCGCRLRAEPDGEGGTQLGLWPCRDDCPNIATLAAAAEHAGIPVETAEP